MTMQEALATLDGFVDPSDPDLSLPNLVHAYQTAERARARYPSADYRWLHLVALIHDAGKALHLFGEPSWAIVGDTHPVGCAFSPTCVYAELFAANPDTEDPRYASELGVYTRGCGLNALEISFGHDIYLHDVLVGNGSSLPQAGLDIIRYHSLYPVHREGAYTQLLDGERDAETLKWVRIFNDFDLYSKSTVVPEISEEVKAYYDSLIQEFCPGTLRW
jgi:inositol oxygenase